MKEPVLQLNYFLKNGNDTEDMDTEAIDHTELNKDQDKLTTADTKGPGDLDSYSIFLPGVPEDNGLIGAGARDEDNKQKTSDYDTTINLDIYNI